MKKKKLTSFQLCLVAMAVGVNVAGGQLALLLKLPIYLDSVGTILTGALLGPWLGMVPNLLSGIIMGMTTDIYSLYFAPVGMITGFMAGLVWKKWLGGGGRAAAGETAGAGGTAEVRRKAGAGGTAAPGRKLWLAALAVAVPGTMVSSTICAAVFGGITSSGSTVLVQLLARTPLGMTASIFLVQIVTDYADRAVSMFLVARFLRALPAGLKEKWRGEGRDGSAG